LYYNFVSSDVDFSLSPIHGGPETKLSDHPGEPTAEEKSSPLGAPGVS